MLFAERLKKLRQLKNMTQEEVANYLGMTRQGYGYYERTNVKHEPDHETTIMIADLFGVTVDYLLGRSDYPYSKSDVLLSEETMQYLHIVENIPASKRKHFEAKVIEYAEFLKDKLE